jgi:hypothetical protein
MEKSSQVDAFQPQPTHIHAAMRTALKSTIHALEGSATVYWLDSGTLLGAIRHEGKFIPWDDDVDIGILGFDPHAFREVLSPQYKLCQCFSMWKVYLNDGGQTIVDTAGVPYPWKFPFVDLFDFLPTDGSPKLIHPETREHCGDLSGLFPLRSICFEEVDVLVPRDAERYLVGMYGNDWKTPVPPWYNHLEERQMENGIVQHAKGWKTSVWRVMKHTASSCVVALVIRTIDASLTDHSPAFQIGRLIETSSIWELQTL